MFLKTDMFLTFTQIEYINDYTTLEMRYRDLQADAHEQEMSREVYDLRNIFESIVIREV